MLKIKAILSALVLSAFVASNAMATGFTGSTFVADLAPVTTVMGLIAVGLGALWGYRKFIKTVNRS